jgi:hypothetical protein
VLRLQVEPPVDQELELLVRARERFDHPELSEVAAGVRVLGAESRGERTDLREREALGPDVELARDLRNAFVLKSAMHK